jgi:phosphoribosylformylglycinamidine (FGAM) synthase PurS component
MKAVVVVQGKPGLPEPQARELHRLLREQGVTVGAVRCAQLYLVDGELSQAALKRLVDEVLVDPVLQVASVENEDGTLQKGKRPKAEPGARVDVWLKPAVTDPVAPSVVRAARHLELEFSVRTGLRVELTGGVAPEAAQDAVPHGGQPHSPRVPRVAARVNCA